MYMSGYSSLTTVFLDKRASTSDADGPKAVPYRQVSASESYWSSQETFPTSTTFLTPLGGHGPVRAMRAARRLLC